MKFRGVTLGSMLAASMAVPANAAAAQSSDWQVSFTPYVWIAGVDASVDIPDESTGIEFDRNWSDTLSKLKFAFMGALNVEHGNWVFFVDGNYLNLASGTDDIEEPVHLDGEVKTSAFESTPLIGYKVVNDDNLSVEVLGGFRYASVTNEIELELPMQTIETERKHSAIAPVIATRLKTGLGGRWGMTGYFDIGGFTDMKSTWQMFGAVTYRLGNHWDAGLGYRHMAIKFDNRDAKLSLSGPVIGFTYKF